MIVVDVESTGTEAHKHSLLSIGAIDFDHPERRFYDECRVREGAHVMPEALAINGFTEDEINDPSKMSEGELAEKFIAWAMHSDDHTLAGQNPYLDQDFIRLAAEHAHVDYPLAKRTIDLHTVCWAHLLARGKKPPLAKNRSDISSAFICNYAGIPVEGKPHIGLNGALWEAEAFSRLFFSKNLLSQFADFPIPWYS